MKPRYRIFSLLLVLSKLTVNGDEATLPNILFCLSDDQSWPHARASGEPLIESTKDGKPWCFWFGSQNPHLSYKNGSEVRAGRMVA